MQIYCLVNVPIKIRERLIGTINDFMKIYLFPAQIGHQVPLFIEPGTADQV
jgi:hypothetical protein